MGYGVEWSDEASAILEGQYQYFLTAFFHYLPGEETIKVFSIGFARYARGG